MSEVKTVKDFFNFWRKYREPGQGKKDQKCGSVHMCLDYDYLPGIKKGQYKNERSNLLNEEHKRDMLDMAPIEFLLAMEPSDFLDIRNMGVSSLNEMRKMLEIFLEGKDLSNETIFQK